MGNQVNICKSVLLLYQAALEIPAKKMAMVNAVAHPMLSKLCQQTEKYSLIQYFKPTWDALKYSGLDIAENFEGQYDLILLLPSKNRQQTHAWMAQSMLALNESGQLIVACANNHGAKSYEKALKGLAGNSHSQSKSKCRIFFVQKDKTLDQSLADQWLAEGKESVVKSHRLLSRPGLFSWDRADKGSLLLLENLPNKLKGVGMDFCCGYGLLSENLLKTHADIEALHILEADKLALDCAIQNTQNWADKVQNHWADAAAAPLDLELDWVVCNPPFHSGQNRDVQLGQKIVANACRSLKRGGKLYLVANRKMPYEDTLDVHLRRNRTVIEIDGFKVVEGTR